MYESHYVAHFFRLWGVTEGATGINPEDALLGNSQNDFDELIGDVAGKVGVRFFLIEFKRTRDGFAQEVSANANGKIHRHALYVHLRDDQTCRQLSTAGHFAGYRDELATKLAFEPYAHAVAPLVDRKTLATARMQDAAPSHPLDHPSWRSDFKGFHTCLIELETTKSVRVPGHFEKGLGLNSEGLAQYVACMYQHLQTVTDQSGHAILGVYDAKRKRFRAFDGTVVELVQRLHHAFTQMATQTATDAPPPSTPRTPRMR